MSERYLEVSLFLLSCGEVVFVGKFCSVVNDRIDQVRLIIVGNLNKQGKAGISIV